MQSVYSKDASGKSAGVTLQSSMDSAKASILLNSQHHQNSASQLAMQNQNVPQLAYSYSNQLPYVGGAHSLYPVGEITPFSPMVIQ